MKYSDEQVLANRTKKQATKQMHRNEITRNRESYNDGGVTVVMNGEKCVTQIK